MLSSINRVLAYQIFPGVCFRLINYGSVERNILHGVKKGVVVWVGCADAENISGEYSLGWVRL